ncbi:MAG: MFS transporter [Nanoarchaeota archaeon]|nr:MFS transporter [Nanoarchaeota archaeon]
MYSFLNLAWFIGPLIAGLLSEYFKISVIFGLSGIFVLISLVYFSFLRIHERKIRKRIDKNIVKIFFDFFKNKERVIAYCLGGGVNYWWSLIYIFIPLYIIKNGLGLDYIGYFLFSVSIPLISFSYFFSNLAGKIGFKRIFKIGFLIPCLASLVCFFVSNVYATLLILVLASVGLSMLEATTEAYFFDTLKGKEDLRFYGPYNTTIDVNHFISRVIGGVILLFFPFNYLFLFFSISMLGFFILSFKTKNINESRRKN